MELSGHSQQQLLHRRGTLCAPGVTSRQGVDPGGEIGVVDHMVPQLYLLGGGQFCRFGQDPDRVPAGSPVMRGGNPGRTATVNARRRQV